MTSNIPVLPIALASVARAFAGLTANAARWGKAFAQARRNRREAHALSGLDCHMLADIGVTHSDLRDAFSEPFWEDPTALLRERAIERRLNRPRGVQPGFHRPATNRPARQTV